MARERPRALKAASETLETANEALERVIVQQWWSNDSIASQRELCNSTGAPTSGNDIQQSLQPVDLVFRRFCEQLMFGSHIAGFCENFAGFGAIHSLAGVTGRIYPDIPHGEAIAVFTPPVMRYNLEECPGRYAEDADAMGVGIAGLSDVQAACEAVAAVEALIHEIDLPSSLSELDVEEHDLENNHSINRTS